MLSKFSILFPAGIIYYRLPATLPIAGEERVHGGYGADKYAKLVALKNKRDPENLFQVNQNIKPSHETRVEAPP